MASRNKMGVGRCISILFIIAALMTDSVCGSTLPEDFLFTSDPSKLSSQEAEVIQSLKEHLKGSLQDYQHNLHVSYSKQSEEYRHRVKRELQVTEDLYWNLNAEVEIPTNFTILKHFYCDGDDYIIVGYNKVAMGVYTQDAKIFRFDPSTGTFTSTGVTIETHGLTDIEPFLISGQMFLAFANGQFSAGDYQGLSRIMTFDPTVPSVQHVQYIFTYGASALEAFLYEGDTYLAVANHRVNSYFRYLAPTKIYYFAGYHFDEIASIDTYAAVDIAATTLSFDLYIAIAQYVDNDGSYSEGTLLYQLDIGSDINTGEMTFEMIKKQIIPSSGPVSLTYFLNEGHSYLAIANHVVDVDGVESFQTDSIIYWWATDQQFIEYQTISTNGAMQFEFLELEFEPNLLLAADLSGLHFYHFSDDAVWVEADTKLFSDPSEDLAGISTEFFNIDNVDYITAAGGTFWTTEYRNLTGSNLFSFVHVNETTTTYVNVTETVYLPACATSLTRLTEENIRNATNTKETVGRGVSKTKDKQVISSDIVLTGHIKIPALDTKIIEIQGGQEFEIEPPLLENFKNNTHVIYSLESQASNFVTKSTDQTIIGPVRMISAQTTVSGTTTADSFSATDDLVSGIDITYIDSVAMKSSGNQTMFELVEIRSDLTVGTNVTVSGFVNDILIPDNVMDIPGRQTVDGSKTFTADITFNAHVTVDEKVNDLDLTSDVVLISQSTEVTGTKNFLQGISLQDSMVVSDGKTVDTVDISEFAYQVLRVSTGGIVTGNTTFQSPVNMSGDVMLQDNTINGINIAEIYNDTVFVDGQQTITARKHFQGDLESDQDIVISGTVNGIDLSERVFRLSTAQTIDSQITVVGGGVTVQQDVVVMETVNGVDLSEEAVLVNSTQDIQGLVVFTQDIDVEGNINVSPNTFINDVDISDYAATAVRINENLQALSGEKIFKKLLTVSGNLTVSGDINGVDIEELYDEIVSCSRPQGFLVGIHVESSIRITGDASVQTTLNGLSIPEDLVGLNIQSDIYGEKTFSELIHITGDLTIDDNKLNGEDLSAFNTNILKKPGNQTAETIHIILNNAAALGDDLIVDGLVNSFMIPDDIVLLQGNQSVTGVKTFDQANLVTGDVDTRDLQVEGMVDSVNIDDLYEEALMMNDGDKCNIGGAKTLATFEVEGPSTVSGTIDGVDLLVFNSTAVYLAGSHLITGEKTFSSAVHFDDDVRVNLVESIDFLEKSSTVIYRDTRGDIRGKKTFASGVDVTGYMDVEGLINGVNVTLLDETYLSKQYEQMLEGSKTFTSEITVVSLVISRGKHLDGIDPWDFLLLSDDETLRAAITFRQDVDIEGSVTVEGLINTVDIEQLYNTAVWLTGPQQVVEGTKTFPSVTVYNNIVIDTGLVDGVDISDLSNRVLNSSRDNEISIETVISGQVAVTGYLQTEAETGGVDLGYLLDDAIVLHEDFNITETWRFGSSAAVTMNSLIFEDDLGHDVQLDQTLLSDFLTSAIRISTHQNITGSIVFDEDINLLSCLTIRGLTDDIDLSEHAVLKANNQTVSGCTRFSSGFRVNADIIVGGNVDDTDLDDLIAERVTYSTQQQITGNWIFANLTADGNITIQDTLNSIDVGDDLVTTYENAVIAGVKDFRSDMVVLQDLDTAEINDVDIVELANKVVLTEGSFAISGQKTFNSLITMEANTDVTGLVNCVDVGLLTSKLNMKTGMFNSSLGDLSESLRMQCIAAASMQSSLGEHPLLLTHWEDFQEIDNPAAGKFHSVTMEGGNTLLALSETYRSAVDRCVGTQLYLCPVDWNVCITVLDELLPASVDVHLYWYRDDAFIILLPSQQSGQCEEHHDEKVDHMTILKLKDPSFNTTLITPHASGVTMFEIGERVLLAVANYKDVVTHSTDVNSTLYELNNSTGHFEVFQEILTHGANAVTHLLWEGFAWLSFANNVLDYKSPIYVYDADTNQFLEHAREGTNHASSVSMFLVENIPFAAISSEKLIGDQREAEFHREITLLTYQNNEWTLIESISGYGILDTAIFAVDDFVYLVGLSLEGGVLTIYEWHHAGLFELYQTIPLSNEYDVHTFVHKHEIMMALSRPAFTSAEIFSWKSKIMKAVIRGKTSDTMLQAW